MTVERYDSVRAAEACLREAEGNGAASQSFAVLRAVERAFWRCLAHTALRRPRFAASCALGGARPFRVYAVRDEKGVVLCAPLHLGSDGEWSVVAGDFVELDFVDFLYARRGVPELAEAFRAVMHRMSEDGIAHVTWRYLETDGVTASLLRRWSHATLETFANVRVSFADGAESFAAALPKNARSVERVARNRLRRERRSVSFSFRSSVGLGEELSGRESRRILRECRSVYLERQKRRYGHGGWLARLFFMHGCYISLSVPGESSFIAVLRVDGRVAAYMEGYVNPARAALEVPRIAIDDRFARYSPGRLLIVETVRWLCANSQLRGIDLCRGDERYKLDLGGTLYETATVRVNTEVTA